MIRRRRKGLKTLSTCKDIPHQSILLHSWIQGGSVNMQHYILVLLSLVSLCYANQMCMDCRDSPRPQDCNIITKCGPSETCHVTQYVTDGGLVLYNTGCLAKNRCAIRKRSGFYESMVKRQEERDVVTCIQCCDGNFCNMQGCGNFYTERPKRGPICFNCEAQGNPEDCRNIKQCDSDEACLIQRDLSYPDLVMKSTCMREQACDIIGSMPAIVGKRDIGLCNKCCHDDFCNHGCRTTLHVPPFTRPPTTDAPTTHKPTTHAKTTHAHVTHAPATHAPTTHAHVTHAPATHVHVTHKPTTHVHVTHKPTTHAPATHKPTTHAPATHKPTTHAPTTHKRTTHAPTTHKPTTHAPTTHKPTTHAPTTHKPTTHVVTTVPPTTPTTSNPEVACHQDNYLYDRRYGLCLKFHTQKRNWTDAEQICQTEKGTLALVTSDTKLDEIKKTIHQYPQYHTETFWVGASDHGSNPFIWNNGKPVILNMTALAKSYEDSNCITVRETSSNTFDPFPCKLTHSFICERQNSIDTSVY